MKAKDADRLSTLRMVKANLMNRQIEKGSELIDDEVTKALQSLVKQRRDSIEQYEKAGRSELAAKEQRWELFAEELRLAHRALGSITGQFDVEHLLGEIFARFCIGK